MIRSTILLGVAVLAVGLVACGGSSPPAVPTLPAVATSASSGTEQQPARAVSPAQSDAAQPSQPEQAVNTAAELPAQLRSNEAPPPAWPTFTPGPEPQSKHRLIYARTRRLYTAGADGSDPQPLKLANESPQLLGASYKDPGAAWLAHNGRDLLYFAGDEAQLWRANVQSSENVQLAERMIPAGKEGDSEFIRILTSQDVAWSSDGSRAALVGAPDSVDVFVVDLTANRLTRVTQDGLRENSLQWSPNSQYLAYIAGDPATGAQGLYVVDAKTQQPTQVNVQPIRAALDLSFDTGITFGGQLTWVSGTQLVFYPRTGRQARSAGIWSYTATDGAVQPILTNQMQEAVWSAEARAWVYRMASEQAGLWLVRLDDPKPELLVEGDAFAPVWAPDGRSVLYSWSDPEATGWDLRVIDLNGNSHTLAQDVSLIQRETSEPGPAGKRYWAPDGDFVLYASVGRDYGRAEREAGYGGDAGPDLENWWIVPAGGGEPSQATDMQKIFYLQEPALSPDGTAWAFIGFSYTDRVQHLYTMPRQGGHPEKVDVGVRWFAWLP